ncbi:MAG: GerMN domain-containing protein [Synergistaceae bacterium]|nr:GerMN domain-containing protein [Synergistaceae bacterium]
MEEKYEDEYEDDYTMRNIGREDAPDGQGEPYRSSRRRRPAREEVKKAPLLFRIVAWAGVILFCFVAGYVGTSLALRMLNRKDILVRSDVAENREGAAEMLEQEDGEIRLNARKVGFTLYYPKEGTIAAEKVELLSGIMDDDIRQVVGKIISFLPGKFSADVKVLHTFRAGNTLYLDFPAAFVSSLASQGKEESTLFITGVVQTMTENFSPIVKVRFLVDGEVPGEKSGSPVDLSVPWQLPKA